MTGVPEWSAYYDTDDTKLQRNAKNTEAQFNYDNVTPCWRGSTETPTQPAGKKMEIHDGGQLFSGICWEIKEKLGNTDDMGKLLVSALSKTTIPAGFRSAGMALLHADVELFGGQHAADISAILVKRGIVNEPDAAAAK